MKKLVKVCLVIVTLWGCSVPEEQWRREAENPELLHRSIKQITDVIVHDIFSPPVASRIYAYTSIAAYEAAIPENPTYKSLAGQLNGLSEFPKPEEGQEYCFAISSVYAALRIGKNLIFSEDKMDEFYKVVQKDIKKTGIPRDVLERSIEFGEKVASHIMAWSREDNYLQMRSFPKYTIEDDASTWKPTPPAYMDAIEPHWNKLRTFGIDSSGQFKPIPPTPFSLDKNSQFYKEAYEVYHIVKNLSQEQREIASFWDCNPFVMNVKGHVMFATKKISPGGHWMNITNVACKLTKANYVESAEAYARVSIALADGFISCWDEKFRSRLIRPENYITQYIDENWTPLLQTPPFPEYTSGHSVISNAAAVTLTKLFGENFAFTDSTEIEFGMPPRKFTSFIQASEEAAISRMYGGIHYRPAIEVGVKEGREIGEYLLKKIKTRNEAFVQAK